MLKSGARLTGKTLYGSVQDTTLSDRAATVPLRLALLSPYWGGNLGDSAILESCLRGFRSCAPGVEYVTITMRPENMQRIHGVGGMRLVAFQRAFYSAGPATDPTESSHRAGSTLSLLARHARRAARSLRGLLREAAHWLEGLSMLRAVDALVVAGGGQLDEEWGGAWGHPYALRKWTLLARAAGKPVFFLSVGVCKLETPRAVQLAAGALARAAYASVRDPRSQTIARTRLGVDAPIVPDLAFGLSQPIHADAALNARCRIGVSPIAYGRKKVWPTAAEAAASNYRLQMIEFVHRCLEAGHDIVLFSTDGPDRDEARCILESIRRRRAGEGQLAQAETSSLDDLDHVLRHVDIVVASRLHGVILSHARAIPTIAVSYDPKVRTHMEQTEQADYCVDFGEVRSEVLLERFGRIVNEYPTVRSHLARLASESRQAVQRQYETAVESIFVARKVRSPYLD
jgi:polysaccharide pyruvyl transferase WcaK-like protein